MKLPICFLSVALLTAVQSREIAPGFVSFDEPMGLEGENYENLVWEDGKALRVSAQTEGEIKYEP